MYKQVSLRLRFSLLNTAVPIGVSDTQSHLRSVFLQVKQLFGIECSPSFSENIRIRNFIMGKKKKLSDSLKCIINCLRLFWLYTVKTSIFPIQHHLRERADEWPSIKWSSRHRWHSLKYATFLELLPYISWSLVTVFSFLSFFFPLRKGWKGKDKVVTAKEFWTTK